MQTDPTVDLSLTGEIVEILTEENSRSVKVLIRPFSLSLPLEQESHLGDSMTLGVRMTVKNSKVNLNSNQRQSLKDR